MAGAGGPKPGGASMEFKEMKEEAPTPPTVEFEHIKVRRVHLLKMVFSCPSFPFTLICSYVISTLSGCFHTLFWDLSD